MDKLFSLQEVAFLLNFNLRTLQGWCAAGRLPAVRVGSRWRVPARVLERIEREGLPR